MFTSRAEYRLLLREDNADLRLREHGHAVGLLPDDVYAQFLEKREMIGVELQRVRTHKIVPSEADPVFLADYGLTDMQNAMTYEQLLRRPDVTYAELARIDDQCRNVRVDVAEQVEIQVKYQGYIDRQMEQVERSRKLETACIPEGFNYLAIPGLTAEVREKLHKFLPDTLGQASRVPGVTPAAITVISIALKARSGR
jgi:tRNA uridine 5-carboxymethylaminomethyl modification enzyme